MWRDEGQDARLDVNQGRRDRAARETKNIGPVHKERGVIPAMSKSLEVYRSELGKLTCNQFPSEPLRDIDLGVPLLAHGDGLLASTGKKTRQAAAARQHEG